MDTYHRWMEVVIPVTMSGCPAIALPAGFDPHGRPAGIQLWGPWRAEFALLQARPRLRAGDAMDDRARCAAPRPGLNEPADAGRTRID
jgi:amidase